MKMTVERETNSIFSFLIISRFASDFSRHDNLKYCIFQKKTRLFGNAKKIMLKIIAIAMVFLESLVQPTKASGIDYSGVPQDGRGGAMPVAGFGWVGYLTPRSVVAVEPIHMRVDAMPVRETPIQLPPSFLPAGSAAASLTRIPEAGTSFFVSLVALALVLHRRR